MKPLDQRAPVAGAVRAAQAVPTLSEATFGRLSEHVRLRSGIHLETNKRVLLESRLRKRLLSLELSSFEAYLEILEHRTSGPLESVHLVEAVTTHKTDFFREPAHFKLLAEHLAREAKLGRKRVRTWSAACSSGPEPYSMGMVAEDLVQGKILSAQTVLATDISNVVLETAKKGIYPDRLVEPISMDRRRRYLLRSKNPSRALVRIGEQIRSRTEFRQLNLTEQLPPNIPEGFSAIFCRNVLIYFEPQVRKKVVKALMGRLSPGGLLFLGHAETAAAEDLEAETIAPSVFRRV